MGINFSSKRIFKFLIFPFLLFITLYEVNIINNEIKAEKKLPAATEKDLFLYRRMGASYLCIAQKAEVDFQKGLTIASATFANVIMGKHAGVIEEVGKQRLDDKRLFNAGKFQIVGSAINICPENIPDEVKKEYDDRLKQLIKQSKK